MKRERKPIIVGLLLLVLIVLPSCTLSRPTQTPARATATQVSIGSALTVTPSPVDTPRPGADKQGGTLVMGFYQEPETLNPYLRTQTIANVAGALLERGLVKVLPDGIFAPDLAKEVPTVQNGGVSEDGLTVTYHLKEGITWSDGEPLTCDDVAFTWEAIVHPQSGAASIGSYQDVASVTCGGDYIVVLRYSRFYPPYLTLFGAILPRHATGDPAGMAEWEYNHNPISLGPCVLAVWVAGEKIKSVWRHFTRWLIVC